MSKDIVLKTGEFSKRSVSRADSSLSNVSKTMETIRTELYGTYYSCDGIQKRVFSANTIETVSNGCKTAHSAWLRLGNISKYLDYGPERLLAVDRNTRSKYTNVWDRFVGGVSGGLISITGGISTLWNNLFGKNKNKTGSSVVLNPYGYLADRFDWGETYTTQEDIDREIEEAKKDTAAGKSAEEAIIARLNTLYEKNKKCGKMVRSTEHEGYHVLEGCYDYVIDQGKSGPCCACSYAMGISILDEKEYKYEDFYHKHYDSRTGEWVWYADNMTRRRNLQLSPAAILEQLSGGKPVLMHGHYNGSEHWVLICGTRNADPETVSFDDFLVSDPWPGKAGVKTYSELTKQCSGWYPSDVYSFA